MADPSDTVAAIHRIKQEIDELTEMQAEALKTATFVGMTSDGARDYDERRQRIAGLVQELIPGRQRDPHFRHRATVR